MKAGSSIYIVFTLLLSLLLSNCQSKRSEDQSETHLWDWDSIALHKKLRIITLYSSTSYFIYRSQEMGYEFELAHQFAEENGLKIEVIVAKNITELTQKLFQGEGDLVAYDIPVAASPSDSLIYCGRPFITHQVLVQRQKKDSLIKDVTELIGQSIYVQEGTRYFDRLKHLNQELGGGILIRSIEEDSITTEDLISMVANGEIPYTIANDQLAQIGKTYYKSLNTDLPVSFDQKAFWVVRKESPQLAVKIDDWFNSVEQKRALDNLHKKYFETAKLNLQDHKIKSKERGIISPYDPLFQKYASKIKWDWRLLAALAWEESNFNPNVVSWAGARGLMQLMPPTYRTMGIDDSEFNQPEASIKGAVNYLKLLNTSFADIPSNEERIQFILASYNAGPGHVFDAMALAKKYGSSPIKWEKHVSYYMGKKQSEEYYNDPVCKNGYCRGSSVNAFVKEVLNTYQYFCQHIPEKKKQHFNTKKR